MSRENQISNFIKKSEIFNYKIIKIADDASFRKYYRIFLENGKTLILMDAPPTHEDIKPFIKIDAILRRNKLLAPEVFNIDYENGFLLLEDFGDISYNKSLKDLQKEKLKEEELILYKKACDVLIKLHKIEPPKEVALYDKELLLKEVMLFIDWYLPNVAKKDATKEQIEEFQKSFLELFDNLSQNRKLVLRDYHADNLFVVGDEVGLIDFQDAVLGSNSYDLVSLLEDIRRDVNQDTVDKIIDYYLINSNSNKEEFLTDYKILSLQRNIKIIGIFARLAIRDKKQRYLNFLPKLFAYVKMRLQDPYFKGINKLFNNFLIN